MGYDGWVEFGGTELVNLSRTVQLAQALGNSTIQVLPETVDWIQAALGGVGYDDITNAPWYDAGWPASAEFAGFVPLSLTGLDDSTLEATVTEYITDGGKSNKPRNTTLNLVANFAIVAISDRGADFGKRWLDRVLRGGGTKAFCSGSTMTYFRYSPDSDQPASKAHRRDVAITRGTSVTRKRSADCSVTWLVTFTLTANDPFEYGEIDSQITELSATATTGPHVATSGLINPMTQTSCPVYDYTPIYDPLYPSLIPSPTAPDFYPAGWNIKDGDTFKRFWVRLNPYEPSALNVVPTIVVSSVTEARRVRVSIWPSDSANDDQCDPLFSAIVNYLPPNQQFYVDGEQRACYVWDGASEAVRRSDSVVYGPDATPLDWTTFNDPGGLLITLDIFALIGGWEGNDDVQMSLGFTPKSD